MPSTTLTTKGQVTIPIEVREQLGLRAGDRLEFRRIAGTARYELARKTRSITSLIGIVKSDKPAPTLDQIDEAIGKQIGFENNL